MFKCSNLVLGRGRWLDLTTTVHEQAKSKRACDIFYFVVLDFLCGYIFTMTKFIVIEILGR